MYVYLIHIGGNIQGFKILCHLLVCLFALATVLVETELPIGASACKIGKYSSSSESWWLTNE